MRFQIQEKGRTVLGPPGPPSAGSALKDKGRQPESWGGGGARLIHPVAARVRPTPWASLG